jgi:alkylation response protein AidB-like acyl-CoA dehydrogenase
LEDIFYLERKYNDQLIPLAKEFNILGLPVKSEYDGLGLSNVQYAQVIEKISAEGSGIRTFFSGHSSLGQKTIQRYGTEDQKQKYLIPSTKGDVIFAFALTEPEAGSEPLSMTTNYVNKGDHYLLNGVKHLITNAGIADVIITFAKGPDNWVSAFLIDTHCEGIEREDLTTKMGMPTTNTSMFELSNYKVPKENLLGNKTQGWEIAKYSLLNGRLSVSAGCVGTIADCLNESIGFAKGRFQHGKEIAKHQLIQEHLSFMKTNLESSRLMTLRAAELIDQFELDGSEESFQRADAAVSEAKFLASNLAWDAADRSVQIFGGRGWSFLYRPGRHLVDTRVCRIYEGTDEIMKLKIASSLLGRGFEAYS